MRGSDERTGSLFSFVNLEERVPKRHPLRKIRQIVNDALAALDDEFSKLYASEGRPSFDCEMAHAPIAEENMMRLADHMPDAPGPETKRCRRVLGPAEAKPA